MTPRLAVLGTVLVILAVCGATVWTVLRDPYDASRVALDARLEAVEAGVEYGLTEAAADLYAIECTIASKEALWRPLIRKPPQQKPPPDLNKLLKDIIPTRSQVGSGDSVRVKVLMSPNDRTGRWVSLT